MLNRRSFTELLAIAPALVAAQAPAAAVAAAVERMRTKALTPSDLFIVSKRPHALHVDLTAPLPASAAPPQPATNTEKIGDLRMWDNALILNTRHSGDLDEVVLSKGDTAWTIALRTQAETRFAAVPALGCAPVIGDVFAQTDQTTQRLLVMVG